MQVSGSRALVTGGASGLGEAAVRRLVAGGGGAAILDLPTSRGAALAEELGETVAFIPVDVTQPDQVEQAVAAAAEIVGRIDVAVCAAGVAPAHRVLSRDGNPFPLDLFRFVIDVNLIGLFDVVRWCVKAMSGNEPGSDGERGLVVTVASIAGFEGQVGQAAYSASKGAIVGMTLPLARELSGLGIRVLTIAPGIMDTPMLAGAPPELRDRLGTIHLFPPGLGDPDAFARLVVHFMENTLLNGEIVRLDGAGRLPPR